MKAAVWYGGKDVRIEQVPQPDPGPDEVLVRIKAVGICGSDLHAYEGISRRRTPPLIMGHEMAGEIVHVGENVGILRQRDAVVVYPILSCGECEYCRSGKENICRNMRFMGLHTPGGFAEHVAVPARNCYRLEPTIPFETASLAEPFAVAVHVVNSLPIGVDDSVLIIGCGVIGSMIAQVGRLRTSGKIIVADIIDSRLDSAKKLGADITINSKKRDVVEEVSKLTEGRGVDVSIEVVGIQTTVQQAVTSTKKGGTIIAVGLLERAMEIDMMRVVSNELKLHGSYIYNDHDFRTSLNLIADGKVEPLPYLTHIYPLEDALKGFEEMAIDKENVLKVILTP